MSGTIADIAIDPKNENTWYVAVGSGGVWKTTNAGTTWESNLTDNHARLLYWMYYYRSQQ